MTQRTLDLIHDSYQEALKSSNNIIHIVENLYNILESAEVESVDSREYDVFIDGLRNCLRTRKMTSQITDLVTYITIVIMYIIRWLNECHQIDIDINLQGRRKSLESDLTKLLRKSTNTLSAQIRDRFGLRGTLLNQPEGVAITYIYMIQDAIIGILAAKNRKMRKDFLDWIENSNTVNSVNRVLIKEILTIPFDVDEDSCKDYIKMPKKNGYQSLHFTLAIQPYSNVIPGMQLEIQLRSEKMDAKAQSGAAAHFKYKEYSNECSGTDNPLTKVFCVDDFSALNIIGFTSYESKDCDADGIHFAKVFVTRRISSSLAAQPDLDILQDLV